MLEIIKNKVKYVGYRHIRSYDPDAILEIVGPKTKMRKWIIEEVQHRIRFRSVRLQCFKRSKVCVGCGLEGTIMSLDVFKSKSKVASAHFNLYAIDSSGKTRLMTKDHIIPRSKGGKNHLDNMQTMCDRCNVAKGSRMEVEELTDGNNPIVAMAGACDGSETYKIFKDGTVVKEVQDDIE